MRHSSRWFLVLWLAVTLGCGSEGENPSSTRMARTEGGRVAHPARDKQANAGAGLPEKLVARKIIYTARVRMHVTDLDVAHQQLKELLDTDKEYVASSNVAGEKGSYREGTWTVRIPVARYHGFLEDVKKLGEVTQETSSADDVSEEYYDLEARVKNKRVEEERLVEHLKQSTGKLEEILAVEKELSRVRGEIEQAEGRLRYLKNRTDFTTVTIHMTELTKYDPESSPSFQQRISRTFSESVETLWELLQGLVLAVIAVTPWLPLIALGGFVGWRVLKRLTEMESAKDKPAETEPETTERGEQP